MPEANGGTNSTTRLLDRSAAQRSPWPSKLRPTGALKLVAETPDALPAKVDCPRTREAAMPSENGGTNSRIRLFPKPETHRSPWASNVLAPGSLRLVAEVPAAVPL